MSNREHIKLEETEISSKHTLDYKDHRLQQEAQVAYRVKTEAAREQT